MSIKILPPKTILITGCSSGIGYHAAHALKNLGYKIIASCRKHEDVTRLQQEGLICIQCDLANEDSVNQAWKEALEITQGSIDALFNNGAFGLPGAIEDLSRQALEHQFATNVFGTQQLTNLVIKQMRKQGHGRIIYNSSVLGFAAMAYRGAYNSSKFAIEGLADTLRIELAQDPIQISLIEPGPILSCFRENAHQEYLKWVQADQSAHRANYKSMETRLTKKGASAPFTLGPEAVTKALIHALQAKNAKARYRVTTPTHLFAILKRLLPSKALDWVLMKAGGDGRR
ncbi:SDR family NAD(P)-dependent oxidoreductase [Thiomicrospira microaerophila]|uniref:SDR family NAD(P)-dependent oxidoreductase n=1 Tax=Thiomicrospira microaerophila TaxID=406020 RepID=UPI00200D59F2|nr:SDR family NAD(P)-dependent oxidoreductase [Thiomicrospira microaerophila]UQB41471.1 SDR family NAD(P)-dependent oxidoreductase [Thiomicrospira microaerophila]